MQKKNVILVTGASTGIGEAAALRLAAGGNVVYAAARRVERMDALKERGVHVLAMDVTDEASVTAGIAAILQQQGRLDVLVNNAGYGSYGAIEDVPLSEARRQFDVNLFAVARLTQLVLPHMRRNGYGRIVNISSMGGKIHEPLGGWYHATKFALEGFSDCLRAEVEEFGIDVVVIEPGGIKTEWGGIAARNLLNASANSAYKAQAEISARVLNNSSIGSDPDVIAKVIEKAVRARRPRTRYAAGAGAGIILFLRKVLSDRGFDRFIRTMYRTI